MKLILNFLTLGLLFFLTACSSFVPPNSTQTLTTREYHQQIEMSGRLSAQYEQNNKPQAIHIKFNWSQTPQQTVITLISPTGQTLATLLIGAQGAQLDLANKPSRFASDANQLILDTLGWPLPVANLRYWLQGFLNAELPPVNSANSASAPGTYFLTDGWGLDYTAWEKEPSENDPRYSDRPKRLDLTRLTGQAGIVSLRIVIDEWNPK